MERKMDENGWGFVCNSDDLAKAWDYFFRHCVRETSHETFLRWIAPGLRCNNHRKFIESVDAVVELHMDCLQDYGLMDVLIAMIGEAGVDGLVAGHYCAIDVATWWLDLEELDGGGE